MYEAESYFNNNFEGFIKINRDTTSLYLSTSLAEQSERRHILDLFNRGIIPRLISIHLKLEATKYPESMAAEIKQLKTMINTAIENAHIITDEIAPHVLFGIGLRAALHELCEKFVDNFNILYYINLNDNEINTVDDSVNLLIFNLVKKLVNGAVRFCNADNIGISLQKHDTYIDLLVQDNGSFHGSNGETISEEKLPGQEFLFEVGEQIYSMGGRFRVDKAAGTRTVYASIPLKFVNN